MAKKQYLDLTGLTTYDEEIKSHIDDVASGKANSSHTHDDRYYTESEIDSKLSGKANSSHTHNYAGSSSAGGAATSANKVNKTLTVKLNGGSTEGTNMFTFDGSAAKSVNITPSEIGAAASSHTHSNYVNQNAFSNVAVGSTTIAADSTTDTLTMAAGTGISVSADTTNDKVTITNSGVRSIATGSSNGTISVNTNGSSANVAVKGLGSAAYTASTAYDAAGSADTALASAKTYTDGKIDAIVGEGASETLDTIGEISAAIEENQDMLDTLNSAIGGKADKTHTHDDRYYTESEIDSKVSTLNTAINGKAASSHTHTIANITNLQTTLDGKASSSHNHAASNITSGTLSSDRLPTVPITKGGTGATTAAAALTNLGLTATAAELNKMDGVTATTAELNYVDGVTSNIQAQLDAKAASSHSHTITASASDDDVVVLSGTNGTNKVTYSASHANSGVTAGTYKSVTVNAKGHITAGTNPTTLSGYGITDAYTKAQVDSIASGKANSSHTHSYAGSSSAGGSATSAVKLDTSTAGSSTVPVYWTGGKPAAVSSVSEAYLSWGGKMIAGGVSPVDAAASSIHSANRFQFAKAAGITVEYSTNGSTFTSYGASDADKIALVSGIGANFMIGKRYAAGTNTVNDKVRITLHATNMGVYTRLQKLLINITTNYASGSNVKVEKAMKGSESTFSTIGTYNISGWSGWNSIPIGAAFGGGSTQTTNIAVLRLTFGITGVNSSNNSALTVLDIVGIGDTYWQFPSNMAKTGHIYSWDASQNVTFPAKVSATSFNGYTIEKSVPSNAVFTDTVYTHPTHTAVTGVPTANQSPAFGGTFTVNQITNNNLGHVTGNTSRTITIPSTLSNGTGTAGLIKTTSTVTSNSGYTACPVINGVPYYKDTNTTYSLSSFGLTATAAELNYCDGVTSNIQTQLNGKAASSHTHSYLPLSGGTLTGNLGLGANSLTIGGATLSYNQSSHILDIAKTSGNTASAIGVKLGTKTVGSATQPIYFNAGTPTACTYTLGKSVPSDAKFTDTTYTSLKNPYSLTVKGNGTQSFIYDGSGAKTLNIKAGTNVSVSSDTSGNITINSSMPSHQHTGLVEGNYTAVLTNYGNFRLSAVTTAAETGTIGTEDIPWRAGYFSEGVYSKGNRIPDIASGTSAAQQVAALSYLDVTITFPFTFSAAPAVNLTLVSTSTAGAIGQITAAVYSVSTTKCVVRLFNGGSSARSPGFHWTATGTKA